MIHRVHNKRDSKNGINFILGIFDVYTCQVPFDLSLFCVLLTSLYKQSFLYFSGFKLYVFGTCSKFQLVKMKEIPDKLFFTHLCALKLKSFILRTNVMWWPQPIICFRCFFRCKTNVLFIFEIYSNFWDLYFIG